ncbi:hypothetical protein LXJ15735_13710 [Lacrimispora xylanolytica]
MKRTVICSLLLTVLLLATIPLINESFINKANAINVNFGIQDVMKNIDNYSDYLEDNHVSAQVVTYHEKECLKIKFDSNNEAIYGPELLEINTKILWKYYSKEYLVGVKISNLDMDKKTAWVSTDYDGGYGTTVSYYLPDFYDMKPDMGDYLQADLDVKKIISKEELKVLYHTAVHVEDMIDSEYMKRNGIVLQQ